MGKKDDERTAARDFVMARLAAARAAASAAVVSLDEAMMLFCDPEEDPKGARRAELLEAADDGCGAAAISIQQAQGAWDDVDPKEGEPEPDDDDDEDDDDEVDDKRRR